jgi:general secretion pathway protein D
MADALPIVPEGHQVVQTVSVLVGDRKIRVRQRAVTSNVIVQSGTDIVIGGLIASRSETAKSGVPVLKDIPLIGEAFTTRNSKSGSRTELLIILRPVVLASTADVSSITAEIRRRFLTD